MGDRMIATNPYDWINPIETQELFAGRKEELSKIMDEILRIKGETPIKPIIAVTGERRVGKTSLLLRIYERCHEQSIKSVIIPVEHEMVNNTWEFWDDILSRFILTAREEGVDITGETKVPFGFKAETTKSESFEVPTLKGLMFPEVYKFYLSGARVRLSTYIIQNDLEIISNALRELGYAGLVLILDEAHILLNAQEIKQQIRNVIQRIGNCGLVFAGETTLTRMFTDPSEPFFGQANVIPLGNFIDMDDVADCALLPLRDDELKLMSPMTVHYIARLSRGKPNQIRLICSSIYKRYANGQQDDLNITIDVLDDVLENIAAAYDDTDLKIRVDGMHRLNSVDLELLYNMTRYPNWHMQDIIDLDESFRGESKSELAIARRKRNLEDKKGHFVALGLMADDKDRYQLMGGEFVSLYLRFLYETQKYGKLSRRLILGKGPPTPFGETTEKLVTSLAYHFGQSPELQRLVFHHYHRDFGDIIERVEQRFSVLADLKCGRKPKGENLEEQILECFTVCELIGKGGSYYLLCLSVRNRDNPRELIQVELYFDLSKNYTIDLISLFRLLNQQAEDARVLIEGYHGFWVELPNLEGLLDAIGIAFEDLLEKLPPVLKWRLSSIQHAIQDQEETKDLKKDHRVEDDKDGKWIELYGRGDEKEAEAYLIQKLSQTDERRTRARLYNDLGYIRCGNKLKKTSQGRKDLETAVDLHCSHLPLTLINLAYLDIDEGHCEKAIEKIEESLLLTLSPVETGASYLRLRLPKYHLGFRERGEQHPANVIEAAYINLAYAVLDCEGYEEALKVLQEGSQLFPSSIPLKHAMARLYLHKKRADLAFPIYDEISASPPVRKDIAFEIKHFGRRIKRRKGSKTKTRH